MTDFPTLIYTSTCEIPTLLYTWSLKKVPLLGGASPYRPLQYPFPSPSGFSTKTGEYLSDIRQFSNCVCYKKYLKHNRHNSLHIGTNICSDVCPWTLSFPQCMEQSMPTDKFLGIFSYQMVVPFYSCVLSYLAMNASEAGGELALIQTSLLLNVNANKLA